MEYHYVSTISEVYSRLTGKPLFDIVYRYYLKEIRPIVVTDS